MNYFSNRTSRTQPNMWKKDNIRNNQHNTQSNRCNSTQDNEITQSRLQNNYAYHGLRIKRIVSKCQPRIGNCEKWDCLLKKLDILAVVLLSG